MVPASHPEKTWILKADLSSQDLSLQTRADRYLTALFSEQEGLDHLSRSQVQKLIEQSRILVNQLPIRAKDAIPPDAEIRVTLAEPEPLDLNPVDLPIPILYQDEHLVVVNKPPGLTVHPSETHQQITLVHALLFHIKDLSGIGGKLRPGIVHRIDKDTSGALVISKTDEAHRGLSALFASHDIERRYWAICYGAPKWDGELRCQTLIGRSPQDRKKMSTQVSEGREAVSIFRRLESFGLPQKAPFSSLIEAKLETGRTHQVRVHLHHLGHSILGDPVYGTPTSGQPKWKSLPNRVQSSTHELPGQALHARVLGFKHPITQRDLYFEAEPFPEFNKLLISCRTSSISD
jgi:23S rRNA pseudouridine1911/1915/1917 synthase